MTARFVNFWSNFRYSETNPSHAYIFGPLPRQSLLIGSVFGCCNEMLDVLYSGESIRSLRHDGLQFVWQEGHAVGRANWFLGVPRVQHPRALWQPHFYFRWAAYDGHGGIAANRKDHGDREFGVSVVISSFHKGGLARRRIEMAHALSRYVPVHANLAMRGHMPSGSNVIYHDVPPGYQQKLSFLSRFTHCLCFENDSFPGYLTEKIFDSFYAGAVPLYCGDPLVEEWFQPDSFIDCSALDAGAAADLIHRRLDLTSRVQEQREALCRVPLEEMKNRTRAFHRRIMEEKGLA